MQFQWFKPDILPVLGIRRTTGELENWILTPGSESNRQRLRYLGALGPKTSINLTPDGQKSFSQCQRPELELRQLRRAT
jgi:hypothetical protein